MRWNDFLLRLRALISPRRAEGDLDEELRFHLEMEARKRRLSGMSDAQARQNARAQFGGVEQVREECRDVRGISWIENLARDVRYGLRMLGRTPAFTSIAVLSLAIGIGANTAIFSLVDAVLLRSLPVRHPEDLVVLHWSANHQPDGVNGFYSFNDGDRSRWRSNTFSWPIFSAVRNSEALAGVIGYSPMSKINITANGEARIGGGLFVSGNYFTALGVRMAAGRPITADDDMAGGAPAAVISYRFWERAFGASPTIIGKTIYVNRNPFTVVGISAREFFGVSAGGFNRTPEIDVSMPIRARLSLAEFGGLNLPWLSNGLFWVQMMGREKPGTNAVPELSALLAANLPDEALRDKKLGVPRIELAPGSQGLDFLRTTYHRPLLILMTIVGVVLLMACANLAGLLLARSRARTKEITVRLALGASRIRLVRQLMVESALLSAGGAISGLLFALWGVRALMGLVSSGPNAIPIQADPDPRILVFTGAIALLTTALFGLAPAIRATRVDVAPGMKEEMPLGGGSRFGTARLLVVAQIAVAVILLAGAALFTRSLANLRAIPLGFNANKLVLFGIAPGENGYEETRAYQFYERVRERLSLTPGTTGVTLSHETPISGYVSNGGIEVDRQSRDVHFNLVGPDFFEVMQVPLVFGRSIGVGDSVNAPKVAVINETAARKYFAGGSPIGKRFRLAKRDVEVVGLVKDAKYGHLRGEPPATVYLPYAQSYYGWPKQMSFEVRTAANTPAAVTAIRAAMRELDRTLPLIDVKTMEGQIDEALSQERLFASLVSLFGAITLALAGVGIYGLVAYSVASRTREIGVRMALGADRIAVMRMVLAQVAVTAGTGLAIGLPAAWTLTRIVESQLYGIGAHDLRSFAVAAFGAVALALLAAALPLRRAMRIDPVRALRYE